MPVVDLPVIWAWYYCTVETRYNKALNNKQIFLKPGFHMSGKSQTIGDSNNSWPSQILSTYENTKSVPDHMEWSETDLVFLKSEKSGAFLFFQCLPDLCDDQWFSWHISKIWEYRETAKSLIIWDFSQHMKIRINIRIHCTCTVKQLFRGRLLEKKYKSARNNSKRKSWI